MIIYGLGLSSHPQSQYLVSVKRQSHTNNLPKVENVKMSEVLSRDVRVTAAQIGDGSKKDHGVV